MMNVKINGMPDDLHHHKWIVCRLADGTAWFYESFPYDREDEALAVAREMGGFVAENTAWLKGIFG